jgi:hypothetical protein
MTKIAGWDTDGVTKLGAMTNGRLNLEFSGTDGTKRNIFVPGETVSMLVASLIAFNAKASKAAGKTDVFLPGTKLLSVKSVGIGSDERGSEFALSLTTKDDLQLRFDFDPNTIEALAIGLIAILEKHGKTLPPQRPEGLRH